MSLKELKEERAMLKRFWSFCVGVTLLAIVVMSAYDLPQSSIYRQVWLCLVISSGIFAGIHAFRKALD